MKRVLRMFAVTAVASAAVATAGWAQSDPKAVISWGTTCPTQIPNMNFGTGPYQIWIGVKNLTAADGNVGTDFNVFYGPNVPDSWRFDDTGCQTGSQVTLNTNANNKGCPALKGANSLTITAFQIDTGVGAGTRMNIRLAITYDNFVPAAGVNYTSWNLIFDH